MTFPPLWRQGINLSGGQRQRISVARALYQHTNVVFLVSAPAHTSLGALVSGVSPWLIAYTHTHPITQLPSSSEANFSCQRYYLFILLIGKLRQG